MKNVLILLLIATPLFSQQKAHVQTEAQKCWAYVQQVSVLDLDKEAANIDSVASLVTYLSACSEILKADKFKSATANNLESLVLTLRDKQYLLKENEDLSNQYNTELVAKVDSDRKLREAISAYLQLSDEYQKHIASDIAMSVRSTPPPALESQRGYWSSFLQGMGQAMQTQAAKPTVHCTSTVSFNTVDTDCR